MPKFKKFVDNKYEIPMIKKGKYHGTDVDPSDRTFKNLPRYANNKVKVKFQDWLLIKGKKAKPDHQFNSIGKSEADGKWWSWSHRAAYGFGVGDKITGDDNLGKKVEYPKLPDGTLDFDNEKYEADFTIKDDAHAKQVAITFADNVG